MFDFLFKLDFTDFWTFVFFPLFPLSCGIIFLYLVSRNRNPVPQVPRGEVNWGLVDVVFLLGAMFLAKFLAQICALLLIAQQENLPPAEVTQEIAFRHAGTLVSMGILFSVAQFAFAIVYLRLAHGCQWNDLGLGWQRIKQNLAVGLVATILIVPCVLVLNVVLHAFLEVKYTHQVLTMVKYSLVATAISTVIVAPIVEEFHFRVLLQGWLQRVHSLSPQKKTQLILGDRRAAKQFELESGQARQSSAASLQETEDPATGAADARVPVWPILVSSLLFASVHAGQGAAPYALFALALGLGWVYRLTHSLIPCVIIHFLLNLWSFTALVSTLE